MLPEGKETKDPLTESIEITAEAASIYGGIISNPKMKWDIKTSMHVGIRYVGYMRDLLDLVDGDSQPTSQNDETRIPNRTQALNVILWYARDGIYSPLRMMFESPEFMGDLQKKATNPFQALATHIMDEGPEYDHISAVDNQPEIHADAARFLEPKQR